MLTSLTLLMVLGAALPYQYSYTIWDWDAAYRDMDRFRQQVDQCADYGFNTIELGASWRECEPSDGAFDFSRTDERVAYITSKGLQIRLRVNLVDWPEWYEPELFQNLDGTKFDYGRGLPSVFNARNREHQHRFAAKLAEHYAGNGLTYTPAFSVHMEVKFGAWNTYEPSARQSFRDWIAGRYETVGALNDAWGTSHESFSQIEPPSPGATAGEPSLDAAANDWIQFREHGLGNWVDAFAAAVRKSDPSARLSVPLGESYRRESAAFANLAYWNYSRSADEIVHSYDFFMHGAEHVDDIALATAIMTGIAQRPVVLEIDGPILLEKFNYAADHLIAAATHALDSGAAGIQVTNWGSADISQQAWMRTIGDTIRARPDGWQLPSSGDVVYYVSKWQNYCFREPDERLHLAQFGLWRALRAANIPTRIVTDENLLNESLHAKTIFVPGAQVIDEPVRERLRALSLGSRVIADQKPGIYTASKGTRGNFGARIEVLDKLFPSDPSELAALVGSDATNIKRIRVAAVQFHTKFDVAYNTEQIVAYINRAADAGASVAVFSEMALTGYTKAAKFRDTLDWDAIETALETVKKTCDKRDIYALVGAPTRDGDLIFCAAVVIDPDGEIIDAYEKIYLAGEQWATPGRRMSTFTIDGVTCGTIICHDERYPHLVQLRALAGAQLIFYISCESGLSEEHKIGPYRAQVQARAVENGVFLVHANAPASRDNWDTEGTSNGHSRIIGPDGNLIAEANAYDDTMVIADIDVEHARDIGMPASLTNGPAAEWIKNGIELVGK